MKAKAEELLMVLLWSAEVVMSPTWRNLDSSFESWAYRNGFARRLDSLARERLLEKRRVGGTREWVYRLTSHGRMAALGGRDPDQWWKRHWDGLWRMLLFDLPQNDRRTRMHLWRWLRGNGFGYLQNSVWIAPDLAESLTTEWTAKHPDVEAFAIFEGRPAHGATDAEIVAGAWDFDTINRRYLRYLEHLENTPVLEEDAEESRARLRSWIQEERELWSEAFQNDPLLPEPLLPSDYAGRKAWERRRDVWKGLGVRMRKMNFL